MKREIISDPLPPHESHSTYHQVSVSAFVANKVLLSSLGEVQVDDAQYTPDFLPVTLNGAWKLLRMAVQDEEYIN